MLAAFAGLGLVVITVVVLSIASMVYRMLRHA